MMQVRLGFISYTIEHFYVFCIFCRNVMFHFAQTTINVLKYLQHLSTTERVFRRPIRDTMQKHLGTNDIATEQVIADSDISVHDYAPTRLLL